MAAVIQPLPGTRPEIALVVARSHWTHPTTQTKAWLTNILATDTRINHANVTWPQSSLHSHV